MKKILIIQNKRIGDVLIASVIANNYKTKFPDSVIHFIAYGFATGVLEQNPNIDKIIAVNEKELKKIQNLFNLVRKVRKEKYDIIFDPYSKTQSRLICKFSGAKQTIGHKSRKVFGNWNYYTHPTSGLESSNKLCGKAIEDRVHLLEFAGDFEPIDYKPKLFLSQAEKEEVWLQNYQDKKVIMLGVLGSTPQKSLPKETIAKIADYISKEYDAYIVFNYSPSQKKEADAIYDLCKFKKNIILDIYAPSIRDFIKLMNQCSLLVANEGGTVHIAKALNKPTFTLFSPYVNKEHWASFEDGVFHTSIHLKDKKPELFTDFSYEKRKKIEDNPEPYYKEFTIDIILPDLDLFLKKNF